MGIIQNALNQTLGTVGMVARLSPGYETKQELHNLGKQEKAIQAQRESFTGDLQPGTTDYQILEDVERRGAELSQRKFELQPTTKNLKMAARTRPLMTRTYAPSMESLQLKAMNAMNDVDNKQVTQKTQKRRFKNYIKDLSPEMQEMAMNLPKNLKKEYMDFKDKEKMNKDGK